MSDPPLNPSFPSTLWSLVHRANGADEGLRREALESLLGLYWPALRAHLILGRRMTPDDADDLLQGFAADRVLQKQFLDSIDPNKGKFRSFMIRCLKNYLVDRLRRADNLATLAENEDGDARFNRAVISDPFEVAWAKQVLTETLKRMLADCQQQGRVQVWALFEYRVLRPALLDVQPVGYEQLIAQFGFSSPSQAANALVTAKRMFRRVMEDVVAQYAKDEGEVQVEISELRAILAAAGPTEQSILLTAFLSGSTETHASGTDESVANLVAELFVVDGRRDRIWEIDDFGSLLKHLLSIPLMEALPSLKSSQIASNQPPTVQDAMMQTTLQRLFTDPAPPLSVLEAVKDCARRAAHDERSNLPSDVASLMYFAAIATAFVRRQRWISRLDLSVIRQGCEVFLAQSWVGLPFRDLFEKTIRSIGP